MVNAEVNWERLANWMLLYDWCGTGMDVLSIYGFWLQGSTICPRENESVQDVVKPWDLHVFEDGKKRKFFKNYTPVDPKQFLQNHVVMLAPDVGKFESISTENSMDYKQHLFMYYCYLGGSMLV